MKYKTRGYEILRIYVRLAFWLSHRGIVVTGKNNIPKGKPIIFAPNHQNALMDPLALVCTNPLQTVWLARADIFRSKFFRPILKFLKVWPVYRIRDGKENLQNNEEIFARVTHLLQEKQSVALFPEAAHSGKRQMLPHKKAVPRIALEAEAKNNFELGLQIVPVGISYSHYWKFGRSLLVQYGEPIRVDNFWVDYEVNPQKAMIDLRDQIYEQLCPLVIDIQSRKYYQEYESIREMAGETCAQRKKFGRNKALRKFKAEKELIARLEALEHESPENFELLVAQLYQYQEELKKNGFNDRHIENSMKANKLKTPVKLVLALLTLPVFVASFLFNGVPFFIPRAVVSKKIKDKTFISSFNYVLGIIVFPLFYLLAYSILLRPRVPGTIALVILLLMPLLGKWSHQLLQFYTNVFQQTIYLVRTKKYKTRVDKLIQMRWIFIENTLEKINF